MILLVIVDNVRNGKEVVEVLLVVSVVVVDVGVALVLVSTVVDVVCRSVTSAS